MKRSPILGRVALPLHHLRQHRSLLDRQIHQVAERTTRRLDEFGVLVRYGKRDWLLWIAALAALAAIQGPSGFAMAQPTPPAQPIPPDTARLVWIRAEGAETCDDGPTVAQRVSTRLGRGIFSESATTSIEGFIEHEGRLWKARLYVRGPDGGLAGSRYLENEASDCISLGAAVTLAVALAIDPVAALRPPAAAPPSSSPAPASPAGPALSALPAETSALPPGKAAPARRIAPEPTALPGSQQRLSAEVTLRAVSAFGLLPATSTGFAFSTQVPADRPLHLSAGALYLPETRTPRRDFGFGLTVAWLGLCAQPLNRSPWRLSVCGSLLLGAIHSVVYTLTPIDPATASGAAPPFRPTFVWPFSAPFWPRLGWKVWLQSRGSGLPSRAARTRSFRSPPSQPTSSQGSA